MQDITGYLNLDPDLTRRILVDFVRSEIQGAGFEHAVLGLSGGVDSALSTFLAAEALGPENVLVLRMPYQSSSPESLEHAQLVIDATGVRSKTIAITGMVDAYLEHVPEADALRRGNVMARCRMIMLYDHSAAFNGLVVGTGNKTEILLGYTTLYGDSACAINPIGDLYKTQVRQLSAAIGVPQVIIDKAPSADLWVGQTDEDELGFTYSDVDQLLFLLVDGQHDPQSIIEQGYDPRFVARVLAMVRNNEFKRMMPPIAKLDDRTPDQDSLHPRA